MKLFRSKLGTMIKVKEIEHYARYRNDNFVANITYSEATHDYFVVVRHIGKLVYAGIVTSRKEAYDQVTLAVKKLTVKEAK